MWYPRHNQGPTLAALATPTSSRSAPIPSATEPLVFCFLAWVRLPTASLLLRGQYCLGVRSLQPYTGWAAMRRVQEKLDTLRSCWFGCHSKRKSVLRKTTGQGVQMLQSGESARTGCIKENTVSCMLWKSTCRVIRLARPRAL